MVLVGGNSPTEKLEPRRLDFELLLDLAGQLQTIAAQISDQAPVQPVAADRMARQRSWLRHSLQVRRARDRYLPAALFGEPGWDMLLELTLARIERRLMSVKALCLAGAVPTTTALRWIKYLIDAGMAERHPDECDARRHFIKISDRAFAGVTELIDCSG